jgi:hypothetical protein
MSGCRPAISRCVFPTMLHGPRSIEASAAGEVHARFHAPDPDKGRIGRATARGGNDEGFEDRESCVHDSPRRRRGCSADFGRGRRGETSRLRRTRRVHRPGFGDRLADQGRQNRQGDGNGRERHRAAHGRCLLPGQRRDRSGRSGGAADQVRGEPAEGVERQGVDVRRRRHERVDPVDRRRRPSATDRHADPARPRLRHLRQRFRPFRPIERRLLRDERRGAAQLRLRCSGQATAPSR